MELYHPSMFDTAVYSKRRESLRLLLEGEGVSAGLVIFIGNGESPMNYADNCYPFRQDSSFLYFAGIDLPDLAMALDLAGGRAILFGNDPTMDDIVWTGPRPSIAELAGLSGIVETRPRAALAAFVDAAARKIRTEPGAQEAGPGASGAARIGLLYLPPYRAETKAELSELSGKTCAEVEAGFSLPLVRACVALREVKAEIEVAEIESAVAVSVEMHRAAIATARSGMRESDIAARVTQVALADSGGLAFPVIATTRGATLHNHAWDRDLVDGGLFLLDAGAQTASGYAGDLTSTFPIGPRFDGRQRAIYDIVLAAMRSAVALLAPGRPFLEVHLAAARSVAAGLKDLGLMKGNPDEIVAAGAHALFFPHGIGHMLGLDVHDMENYGEVQVGYDGRAKSAQFGLRSLRLAKPLKAGMVHTIEPGIYFIPRLIESWRSGNRFPDFIAYENIGVWMDVGGIRNEEDWLITETGARRLGPIFDKSPEHIESLRA
jgi:Xaa-Pro aminopeptidase